MYHLDQCLYSVEAVGNLRDMLLNSARNFADRPAFLKRVRKGQPFEALSYREYADDVFALGTALYREGLGSGVGVAILAETRYEWYVSYLAVLSGEARVVPLDKELSAETLAVMLNAAGVSALIFSKALRRKVQALLPLTPGLRLLIAMDEGSAESTKAKAPAERVGEEVGQEREAGQLERRNFQKFLSEGRRLRAEGDDFIVTHVIDPDETRILLFTSGTMSQAKAVMHSHGTITANLVQMNSLFRVFPEDVFLSVLPLHHSYECTCGFLCPIQRGATVAICEGLRYIRENLEETKATIFCIVPLIAEAVNRTLWKGIKKSLLTRALIQLFLGMAKAGGVCHLNLRPALLRTVRSKFGPNLRMFVIGGAALDPVVEKSLNRFGYLCLTGYGLTECAPLLAFNSPEKHKEGAAGYLLPEVELLIDKPNDEGVGEIIARGPNIMRGYWHDPEETAKVLRNGWFYTGDLGCFGDDGFLYIRGRSKNVIVTKNGKNIYPEELEFLLGREPGIAEALVTGRDQRDGDLIISAEIFPRVEEIAKALGKALPSPEEIRKHVEFVVKRINQDLPQFKAIRRIDIRETPFDKTSSQKIKRYKAQGQSAGSTDSYKL